MKWVSNARFNEAEQLPHDEDDFLWTAAMYFKVEGVTFERLVLVTNLSDWTLATTGACMRVEDGLELYFLIVEVGHDRGGRLSCSFRTQGCLPPPLP